MKWVASTLVMLVLLMTSCQSNEPVSERESLSAMQQLELDAGVLNERFGTPSETRGFWDWIKKAAKTAWTFVSSDACGALGAAVDSDHKAFTWEWGRDVVHGAVDASFDAVSQTSLRSDDPVAADASTIIAVLPNLKEESPEDQEIYKRLQNKYDYLGVIHNKAFYAFAERVGDHTYSMMELRQMLHEEVSISYHLYTGQGSSSESVAQESQRYADRYQNREEDGEYEAILLSIKNEDIPALKSVEESNPERLSEVRIMSNYVRAIQGISDAEKLVEYANEFNDLVSSSDVSSLQKQNLLLYSAIATHSHILWKNVTTSL